MPEEVLGVGELSSHRSHFLSFPDLYVCQTGPRRPGELVVENRLVAVQCHGSGANKTPLRVL